MCCKQSSGCRWPLATAVSVVGVLLAALLVTQQTAIGKRQADRLHDGERGKRDFLPLQPREKKWERECWAWRSLEDPAVWLTPPAFVQFAQHLLFDVQIPFNYQIDPQLMLPDNAYSALVGVRSMHWSHMPQELPCEDHQIDCWRHRSAEGFDAATLAVLSQLKELLSLDEGQMPCIDAHLIGLLILKRRMKRVDSKVAVSGGGPNGLLAAVMLKLNGFHVTLYEKR